VVPVVRVDGAVEETVGEVELREVRVLLD